VHHHRDAAAATSGAWAARALMSDETRRRRALGRCCVGSSQRTRSGAQDHPVNHADDAILASTGSAASRSCELAPLSRRHREAGSLKPTQLRSPGM